MSEPNDRPSDVDGLGPSRCYQVDATVLDLASRFVSDSPEYMERSELERMEAGSRLAKELQRTIEDWFEHAKD